MRNWLTTSIILALGVSAGLGCGSGKGPSIARTNTNISNADRSVLSNANDSLANKAINVALGENRLGVPECDELFDILAEQAKSPDDNLVARTAKEYLFNKVRDDLRRSLEKNKNDKVKMASDCREFKAHLDTGESNANTNSG